MTHPDSVTDRNSEVGSPSDSADTPSSLSAPNTTQTPNSEVGESVTHSDMARKLIAASEKYFTPPSVLNERAASVKELAVYPRAGAWTSKVSALRPLGVGYWRLIGLPVTVVLRYVEWLSQRPGRAILTYVLWRLLISAGPGRWTVIHVFPSLGSIAKWLFL